MMTRARLANRWYRRRRARLLCGLLLLLAALGCSACGRPSESSIPIVSAAPAAGHCLPPAADTFISSWSPDAHYASAKTLLVRSDGGKATLLRFELPRADPQTLQRAVLRLYVLRAGSYALTLRAYPLWRPWQVRAVNWRQAEFGSLWSLPGASDAGCDRAVEPAATGRVVAAESWLELDLTDLTRRWLAHPDGNYGLLLTGSALEPVECAFAAAERGAEYSPLLELSFAAARSTAAADGDVAALTCAACRLADVGISASAPQANLAASPTLELAADGSRAILLRISDLPMRARLERATLSLYALAGGPGKVEIVAQQMARDWQPEQANWLHALANTRWASPGAQTPGADYAPALAAVASLDRAETWVELDITAALLSWLEHPELNDGLILRARAAAPLSYTFASAESPRTDLRPQLKLLFRSPSP